MLGLRVVVHYCFIITITITIITITIVIIITIIISIGVPGRREGGWLLGSYRPLQLALG